MVNKIIFSKDRAAQLDLFLSSMQNTVKEYVPEEIKVLYTYSNEEYNKGYELVKSYHPGVVFKKEENFKKDLMGLLDVNEKYTVFFVDDIIWKNNFSWQQKELRILEKNTDIICYSLRIHPNLKFCYTANVPMNKPVTLKDNIWLWYGESGDYGYPLSLDGHIFLTNKIYNLLNILNYKNPNDLEGQLASSILQPNSILRKTSPRMLCSDKSYIINNPCNKVQTNNPNRHGKISSFELNELFLQGKRVDYTKYFGINNIACHQELPIYW